MTRRLALLVVSLTLFCSSNVPAGAATADPAVLKPIDAIIAGANAGNVSSIVAAYTSDAVIIDEFAPYRWSGPNAAATWFADFGAFLKKLKVTEPKIGRSAPSWVHPNKSFPGPKGSAYVVVPATFTYKAGGKAQKETGSWTFVLVQTANGWKVQASAWAKLTDTGE